MIFTNHVLSDLLAPYIEAIFHFKDFIPDHSKERVIPTGHISLIFELDDFTRYTYDNDTLESNATYTKVWLSGQHEDFITISAHEKSEMLVVQFKSHGGHPFIHLPLIELNNKIRSGEVIFGNQILKLHEQLVQLNASTEKLAHVDSWLHSIYNEALVCPSEIVSVVAKIQEATNQNLASATIDYPFSSKHLIDQFKKYIGITPKRYHRIIRFNAILQKVNDKRPISWSEIAYQCGFADQSHFIKEFKRFSGYNPSEFIADQHQDEANFFPLDRPG